MITNKPFTRNMLPFLFIPLLITGVSWNQLPEDHPDEIKTVSTDTVPDKSVQKDFEKELRELQRAEQELEKIKQKDWKKMQEEFQQSLQKIDLKKMQAELEKSLKEIDFQKMQQELQASLQKLDVEKMQLEIKESLNKLNDPALQKEIREEMSKAKLEMEAALKESKEIQKEVQEEMKKVNKEVIQKEMAKVKLEMDRTKKEWGENKLNMEKEIEKAKQELGRAQKELKGYQEMVYMLEAEGLLETTKDYTIEFKSEELIINGVKQSETVKNKYKKFFLKNNTTITRKNGELNVQIK